MIKATAVLITKEKTYPREVLDSLLGTFEEYLIETECPSVHRRYELALKARNDLIYVQDDDCIADPERIYRTYNGQITNAITSHHYKWYKDKGVTLVGWGAFFPKSMIDFSKYLNKYPVDDLFLSQTDRVFTYLNQPFNSVITDIKHLPTATQPGRMHTSPGHWDKLEEVIKRLHNIN